MSCSEENKNCSCLGCAIVRFDKDFPRYAIGLDLDEDTTTTPRKKSSLTTPPKKAPSIIPGAPKKRGTKRYRLDFIDVSDSEEI